MEPDPPQVALALSTASDGLSNLITQIVRFARSDPQIADAREFSVGHRTKDAVDPESAVHLELTHLVSGLKSVDAVVRKLVAEAAEQTLQLGDISTGYRRAGDVRQ